MRARRTVLSLAAAALATALVLAAYAVPPKGPAGPPTARRGAIPVLAGATVQKACSGNVVHVSICRDPQHCTEALTAPCAPYGCDADKRWCASSCVTTADCSAGSACDTTTSKCAMMPNQCADAFTVVTGGSQIESCSPYRCLGGRCAQQCQTEADCADGYSCHDHVACVRNKKK